MPWNRISIAKNIPNTQNGAVGDIKIITPVIKVRTPENSVQPQPAKGLKIKALILRTIPAITKKIAKKLVNTIAVFTGVVKA